MERVIQVFSDAEAVSVAAAEQVVKIAAQAIAERGGFYLALAGGSTPKRLYQHLASEPFKQQIDWKSVHIYFGDERSVGPEHADSNYRMACEALLNHLDIPAQQIHRIEGEQTDLQNAAQKYEEALQLLPSSNAQPQFDLVLLGMGDDGHTASLFPGTSALDERSKPVVALAVPQLNTSRVTLTYPVINNAQQVMFLVAGEAKAARLEEVLVSAPQGSYPVQSIQARSKLSWLLDKAAAAQLPEALLR